MVPTVIMAFRVSPESAQLQVQIINYMQVGKQLFDKRDNN